MPYSVNSTCSPSLLPCFSHNQFSEPIFTHHMCLAKSQSLFFSVHLGHAHLHTMLLYLRGAGGVGGEWLHFPGMPVSSILFQCLLCSPRFQSSYLHLNPLLFNYCICFLLLPEQSTTEQGFKAKQTFNLTILEIRSPI